MENDLSQYSETIRNQRLFRQKDIKSNGQKNVRARFHKQLTDEEYLEKIANRNNELRLYNL